MSSHPPHSRRYQYYLVGFQVFLIIAYGLFMAEWRDVVFGCLAMVFTINAYSIWGYVVWWRSEGTG